MSTVELPHHIPWSAHGMMFPEAKLPVQQELVDKLRDSRLKNSKRLLC